MAVMKKSVAFEESVAREAMEVAGEGNFSAFVNDSVAQRLQRIRIKQLLDETAEEFGPIPVEVRAEARRQWDEIDRSP
jgi:hypothetical protein